MSRSGTSDDGGGPRALATVRRGPIGILDAVVGELVTGCEVIGQIRVQSHRVQPVRKVEPATHAGRHLSWLSDVILNFADDPIWPSLPALLDIVGRHIFDAEIGVDDAVLVGPGGLVPEDGTIRRVQLHILASVVRLAHFSSEPVPILSF